MKNFSYNTLPMILVSINSCPIRNICGRVPKSVPTPPVEDAAVRCPVESEGHSSGVAPADGTGVCLPAVRSSQSGVWWLIQNSMGDTRVIGLLLSRRQKNKHPVKLAAAKLQAKPCPVNPVHYSLFKTPFPLLTPIFIFFIRVGQFSVVKNTLTNR